MGDGTLATGHDGMTGGEAEAGVAGGGLF